MADKYMYWLDGIKGLGKNTKKNLLQAFGSAEEVYKGSGKLVNCILEEKKQELFWQAKGKIDVTEGFERACREGIELVSFLDDGFPKKLLQIPDAPLCIYYKGQLPKEELISVAVIGARECSDYGEYVAVELGKILGERRIQVISGMARGIDGISQSAALKAGGSSFGVLGCGVDICYPKSNRKLYHELCRTGGILSEYPPGTEPMAKLFPPRNRIVSGLADVLVVIEARQRSGTSITVEMALEQGKDIYAVPGRVTDRLSDGCNRMIKEGAHVFLFPEDFIEDLKQLLPKKSEAMRRCQSEQKDIAEEGIEIEDEDVGMIAEDEELTKTLRKVLDYYPQSTEQIADILRKKYKTELRQDELSAKLIYMCLLGMAKQSSPGWFARENGNPDRKKSPLSLKRGSV